VSEGYRESTRAEDVITMPPLHRDLIVVGASAGGVEALRAFVAELPAGFTGAVAVVLHLPSGGTSALAQILHRFGRLPAVTASDGLPIRPGTVHVAPPNHHLLVIDDQFALSHGPTENGHRPAVNALFRSAAVSKGARVIGVQLSGVLDDGVAGLVAIKAQDGLVVVQDPADALYPGMPENAIRHVRPDHILPAAEIGRMLAKLTRQTSGAGRAPPPAALVDLENVIARNRRTAVDYQANGMGTPSGFSCPDCQGVLSELGPGEGRYRCRVGHAWTGDALLHAQGDAFERALWTALRSLDEKASMARRMTEDAGRRGSHRLVEHYNRMADESSQAADVLRERLTAMPLHAALEAEP
jgi:two-component system, chemotaxis family, protein-glutamate methylesterase/glutaminase